MRFAFDDDSESDLDDSGSGLDDSESDLDRDFPLGDGTADTSASAVCPYCGEQVTLSIDPGGGDEQEYVEDCEVCCQPWSVGVRYAADGGAHVQLTPLDP